MRTIGNRTAIALLILTRAILLLPVTILSLFQVNCGAFDDNRTVAYGPPQPLYGVQIVTCEQDSDCQTKLGTNYVCSTDTKTCNVKP
jgi:hypothetical protein